MHRKIIDQVGTSDPTVFTQYDYASASSAQGAGQDRVSKLVRTGTATTPIYERTIYIDGVFEYVILEDTSGTYEKNYICIMDDKSRIAEIRIGSPFPKDIADDITYTLENNIGSSVVRLDINGTVIDREEYYPFGDSSLRTFTYKRYRYVGKERDQESGLYYYGARYYAAWTCRFISVDPLAAQYNQLTPYQNAGNNPINDFDIDGMQSGKTQQAGNNSMQSILTFSGGSTAQGPVQSVNVNISGTNQQTLLMSASTGNNSISTSSAAKHEKETQNMIVQESLANTLRSNGLIPEKKAQEPESASSKANSKIFAALVGLVSTLALAVSGVGIGLILFSTVYSLDMLGAGVSQKMNNIETQPLFQRGTTNFGSKILGLEKEEAKLFGNVTYAGLGLIAGGGFRAPSTIAAKTSTSFAEGSFSVFNWKGYPAGGIKPTGPFRLLEGAEYTSARNLANSTNAAMRRANPEMFKGLQIHEIHPVKFGGSPTDLSNKIFLTPSQHAQYTNFWNALMRSTK